MTLRCRFTRRSFAHILAAAGVLHRVSILPAQAQPTEPAFSYPVGLPERPLGDGLFIRHGYATENTWYNPGWWHTGEDWYLPQGDTAGVAVFAAAAAEIVYAGGEYPGRVVILAHEGGLYSMYGHLDYALAIETGQRVVRGQQVGTVLERTDGRAPSHLHFELRTFFTTPEVNGDAPRYAVGCGHECPPGPGYWPIDAPEHPSQMGWLNPTHVINRRAWPDGVPDVVAAAVSTTAPESTPLWTAPGDVADATTGRRHGHQRRGHSALVSDRHTRWRCLGPGGGSGGHRQWVGRPAVVAPVRFRADRSHGRNLTSASFSLPATLHEVRGLTAAITGGTTHAKSCATGKRKPGSTSSPSITSCSESTASLPSARRSRTLRRAGSTTQIRRTPAAR
jgi:murein DD-endopeptidase MepM/ murein hydrolase activator NlpD